MKTKTCKACNQEKPLTEFSRNSKEGNFAHTENQAFKITCKVCCAAYAKEWRKNKGKYTASGKIKKYPPEDRPLISAIRRRLNEAKVRVRKEGTYESDLDADYLYQLYQQQQGKCKYSGITLRIEKDHLATISIDKIHPNKGYVKGNIQWLTWAVNRAKGEMSEEDFLRMCKVITVKCND